MSRCVCVCVCVSLSLSPPGGWTAVRIGIGPKTDKSAPDEATCRVHFGDEGATLGQRFERVFSMVGDGDMALATDDRLSHTAQNFRVTDPPTVRSPGACSSQKCASLLEV